MSESAASLTATIIELLTEFTVASLIDSICLNHLLTKLLLCRLLGLGSLAT